MSEKKYIAKAGMLLCVDSGEFSDYSVTGFFVVLQDFYPMGELEMFKAGRPDQRENYFFDRSGFLAALRKKGLLLEIEYGNLFLGHNTTSDNVTFTP